MSKRIFTARVYHLCGFRHEQFYTKYANTCAIRYITIWSMSYIPYIAPSMIFTPHGIHKKILGVKNSIKCHTMYFVHIDLLKPNKCVINCCAIILGKIEKKIRDQYPKNIGISHWE